MTHHFGAHTIDKGGIHMAVRRAGAAGMNALQVFSAMPQFYNEKVSVKPERVQRFTDAMAEAAIGKEWCMVHAAYVLNTASPEPEKYARARAGLARELERTTALGVLGFCFHPGSAGSSDPAGAIERIGEAITHALETVPGGAKVFIENTAGAGRTMGRTPEEIAGMLAVVPKALRARAGYGLDTCHLYASGHDFTASRAAAKGVLDHFTDAVGAAPSFFHFNDSQGELGSNRDRHALIGEGRIGEEPFRWLLHDRRSHHVPIILETPQENAGIADDDPSPDPLDVRMITLLRHLATT